MKEVKIGDVVHVRMTVVEMRREGTMALVGADEPDHRAIGRAVVTLDKIVHVETRPLQVGDRVKFAGPFCKRVEGKILGVWNDSKVWVEGFDDTPMTYDVSRLERV